MQLNFKSCVNVFLYLAIACIFVSSFKLIAKSAPMSSSDSKQTIFILLGAPGSGKGTQSLYLSDKYSLPQIATGDLFRDHLRRQTMLGQKAKSYMDQGQLVPDELVLDMLFDRLSQSDCERGYILDGFPRTIPQAEALTKKLPYGTSKIYVISLEVPDEMILERLTGRLICEQCSAPYHKTANPPKISGICDRDGGKLIQRKDDTEAVVKERLKVFHEQTEPVKFYFQNLGNLLLVDGSLSKDQTISQINSLIVD